MERIGDILQNCQKGTATPSAHTIRDFPDEPEYKPDLAKSLGVMSLNNTFSNFESVPGTERAIFAIKRVIDNYTGETSAPGPEFMMMVYGGVGNGKTHLLEAASLELYSRGKFIRVQRFSELLSNLRAAIDNPERSYDQSLAGCCYTERLLIDDIGAAGSLNDFGQRVLESIVVARYGRSLLTIMTSNVDIKDLPERVVSRFEDTVTSFLVLNEGKDYRPHRSRKEEV